MPEVSVIIPTYNRAEMIQHAIGSVLGQTYQDFELIVVDDGSTDGTEGAVRQIKDPRISYIRLDECSGSSSKPRNVGIAQAKGKYIALLDSDDKWEPTLLEKLTNKMREAKKEVGAVYCWLAVTSPKGKIAYIIRPAMRGRLYPYMLSRCAGSVSASLIKRECFDKVGVFDEGNIIPHWDMWIRLTKHYEFDFVPEVLAKYNYHEGQFTESPQSSRYLAMLEKYAEDYVQYPKELQRAKYSLGIYCAQEGDRYRCLKYSLPFVVRSLQWKTIVYFVASLITPRLAKTLIGLYRDLSWRSR